MWVGGFTDTQTLHSAFLCSDNVCLLLAKNAGKSKLFFSTADLLLSTASNCPFTASNCEEMPFHDTITSIRACIAVEDNKDSLGKRVKKCHYGKIPLYYISGTFTDALGW